MDRLPFELLGHISDCISLEPLPQLRQGSLASLSRTNKTFYTATRPTLYRDPVLLSDWRARCYEKTIGNKVNPWLLSGSRRKEKQWWVPRSALAPADVSVSGAWVPLLPSLRVVVAAPRLV
ncbi:hypothetical protein JCM3765_006228 [Sporobolomyces pararoseus]